MKQHIEKNELTDILSAEELKEARAKAEKALANETMDEKPAIEDSMTESSPTGK